MTLPGEGTAFTIDRYPDRGAWLAARRSGIGGSDAPSLWLPGKYGSLMSVYCDKRGLREDDGDSIVTMVGRHLEPGLRTLYAEITGRRVEYPGEHVLLRSTRWPWMLVSLDGVTFDDVRPTPAPLELKNRGGYASWDDGIPLRIQLQMQHQLAVTGWDWASGMGLLQGNKPAWQDIERDERWIAAHVTRCSDLWARVQDGEPPESDDSEATADALRALYAGKGEEIERDEAIEGTIESWREAREDRDNADGAVRWAENKIRRVMGDAEAMRTPHYTLTLKWQKNGRRVLRLKGE